MASFKILLALCALISCSLAQVPAQPTFGDGKVGSQDFKVYCDDTHMAVWFNKGTLDARELGVPNNRTWQIYFEGERDNTACTTYQWDATKVDANYESLQNPASDLSSSVHLGAGINDCGINYFADATHIIYNTTVIVTYGQNPNAQIGREEYDKYNVMCLRNRTVNEMVNFNVTYRATGNDAQNETEDFSFTFTHTDMADAVTTVYKLGDYIKFSMASNTARSEVKAVIQRCWTTTDGSANSYELITNRCDMESGTSWVANPSDASSIFKTEAFRYLAAANNKIYAQCLVRVCLDTQSTDECTLCTPGLRKRRSTEEEDESTVGQMMVVKSPVFYIIDKETPSQDSQGSSGVLSGTNGLIVIILLATLVFVIAAAIVKKVFFSAPAAVAAPVVAYQNKAMA